MNTVTNVDAAVSNLERKRSSLFQLIWDHSLYGGAPVDDETCEQWFWRLKTTMNTCPALQDDPHSPCNVAILKNYRAAERQSIRNFLLHPNIDRVEFFVDGMEDETFWEIEHASKGDRDALVALGDAFKRSGYDQLADVFDRFVSDSETVEDFQYHFREIIVEYFNNVSISLPASPPRQEEGDSHQDEEISE